MSRAQDTVTAVLPPLQVEDSQALKWDAQCEVLVLGWGAAGACAALQARAEGADVLVADRFTGGGASAKSGGVVYAGGGTRQQRAAGFSDSPEAMFDYLKHETQGVVSDDTLRRFCNDSVSNLQWLEGHGASYSHEVPPGGKTSYPQDGYFLYYSGNELVPLYGGANPPTRRPRAAIARSARASAVRCCMRGSRTPASRPACGRCCRRRRSAWWSMPRAG